MRKSTLQFLFGVALSSSVFAGEIPRPNIPDRTFNVTDFKAAADGKTLDTAAIQKAIDAASAARGGHVVLHAGAFLTGPLHLASNIDLHLDREAVLLFSDDVKNYKLEKNAFENCMLTEDAHDVSISGDGVIDGQGAFWWKNYVRPKDATGHDVASLPHRPYMVVFRKVQRLLIENVTFRNSPSFHLVPQTCQDVNIIGAKFIAPLEGKNTDAVDPSGWNYRFDHCTFDVGDDNIAIKPTFQIDPNQPSCLNFLVTNCTFLKGHGLSIGGQTNGGMKGLVVRDCTFDGTDAGIRLKAGRDSGGLVEDLLYENITMKHVKVPIFITSYYPSTKIDAATDPAQPITKTTPIWKNIVIRNVTISDCPVAGRILGVEEMPVDHLLLEHVSVSAEKGFEFVNAKNVRLNDSQITVKAGPAFTAIKADVSAKDSKVR